MLDTLRIGVVVTTYNSPDWLEKVFWGYANQSDSQFELIIADDGSTDETKRLIERYREELPFPVHHVWHEDQGFRKTTILNTAIRETSSEYLIFTDGDCIPAPDFVAVHRQRAEKGRFLSGGYYKLTAPVSDAITKADVDSGSAFRFAWLSERGQPLNFKSSKLLPSSSIRWVIERLTPTKRSWNGMNSSAFRADILAVNGFDERMRYGSLDREFGERLVNKGLRGKQIRYSAICLHLEHERSYDKPESWELNRKIRAEVKENRSTWTKYGLSKTSEPTNLHGAGNTKTEFKLAIAPAYRHLESELFSTLDTFDQFGEALQKGRNTIRRGTVDGLDITIKSFKRPASIQALIYGLFRPSKAKRSYEYAVKLTTKGIGTAEPIAYIEYYNGCRLAESYFISRYIEHDFTIREVLLNKVNDKAKVFQGFVDFTAKLHNSEVLHLDHSPGNTLIQKHDGHYDFSIIDINRMEFKTLNLEERLNNFVRLAANEDDLETLATLYATAENHDAAYCIEQMKAMSRKREKKMQFKRKLKKLIKR